MGQTDRRTNRGIALCSPPTAGHNNYSGSTSVSAVYDWFTFIAIVFGNSSQISAGFVDSTVQFITL